MEVLNEGPVCVKGGPEGYPRFVFTEISEICGNKKQPEVSCASNFISEIQFTGRPLEDCFHRDLRNLREPKTTGGKLRKQLHPER